VVGQLTRMITYEVILAVSMTPGLADGLEKVELTVHDTQDEGEIVSVTVFQMDDAAFRERRLTHTLHLTAGRYDLAFKFIASGNSTRALVRRALDVSGDTAVSLNLP
jgi:hypothetical protein